MEYQLLVLDVDGTATNSAKQVTEKTRDAVIRLQERGVQVVIASGRAPNGVYPVAEVLEGAISSPSTARRSFVSGTEPAFTRDPSPLTFPRSYGRILRDIIWAF